MKLKPEYIEEFKELVKRGDYDALEYWYPKLNPLVKGIPKARKCTLVSLASGNMSGRIRNRINCLLYGEPGTGKSMIRNWVQDKLDGIGASPQSSSAGLIYDARGEGTPGALSIAHETSGIVAIEELSGFKKSERSDLRQALESGYYDINKGDKRMRIPAEVRCIACANEIDHFSPALLERFDLKVKMEKPDKEEEKNITTYLYQNWENDEILEEGEKLKQYLQWIRNYQPEVKNDVKAKIIKMKDLFIDIYHDKGNTADIRQKQTFYRTCKVIARLNYEEVKTDHYLQAIKLHNGSMPEGIITALKTIIQ